LVAFGAAHELEQIKSTAGHLFRSVRAG
jgi:hypothetical protein